MNAWNAAKAMARAAGLQRATGRDRASDRYRVYRARAAAVGAEPWLTPWTGPAAPTGADTVALPLIRWAPAGARPWLPVNDPARPWLASC